jgi:serine/threonine protein kinase
MLKGSPYDEHADRPQSLLEDSLQDIPVELDALIRAMLAKNPAERPKSPDEVRAKLENLDLDSTVMGVRLAAIRDAVMPTDPTNMELELPPSTKDLDAPTLHAMEPFRKAALEEAYGDTIVRDRKDLGEDSQYPDADPSAFADTHLSLDKKAILVAISEARPPVLSPPAKSTSQSPPPTARPATVPSKQRALPDAITDVAPPPAKKPTVLPTPILIAVFVLVAAVASAIVILLLGT